MKTQLLLANLQKIAPSIQTMAPNFSFLFEKKGDIACYLVACAYGESIPFVNSVFKKLTGYEPQQLQQEGAQFWFSRIHAADRAVISRIIAGAHLQLSHPDFQHLPVPPLVLEYRFQRADERWIWLREYKWIVEFTPEGIKDKILCFLEDITAIKEKEATQLKELLEREKSSHTLLEVAMQYNEKQEIKSSQNGDFNLENGAKLTKREKEVLRLLAAGNSTKEIASQLFVSENTIETHRRHLLQKFGVKNSVELIARASQPF